MLCAKCKAPILKDDETANHGAFHEDCHTKWILELYRELEGRLVKAVTASSPHRMS